MEAGASSDHDGMNTIPPHSRENPMSREIVLRVRVDDPTDELLSAVAKINDAPKAQVALHFLIKGLDDFIAESRAHGPQDAPRQAA